MSGSTIRSSLACALGAGITIVAVTAPSALVDHRAPVLRAILETSVALIGTLVALLAFGRFRRSGSVGDLSIVCAVALLAWVHTFFSTVPGLVSPSVGNGAGERFELWGGIVVRTLAAGFLLAAARTRPPRRPRRTWTSLGYDELWVPVAAGAGAILLLVWLAPIDRSGLIEHVSWQPSTSSVLQFLGAALFFAAFLRLSRQAGARSDPFLGWIGAGCVFAGFAMISYALLPAGRSDWLRPGDLLRAAAVATWAVGAVSEIVSYWTKIAESARRETRRVVALELHDGLAQELALLSTYTFASAQSRSQPEWHEQLQMTATRALAEARRAIVALATDEPVSFGADLERTAESISNDIDIRVEVDAVIGASTTDSLQRESIVRIVREAVTNAVRHGGAKHIDILFEAEGSPVLRVFDDGVGFDPARVVNSGRLGLVSMRERAEAIGASLAVRSAPGQGTTVEVLWP
jgi:signal transduction histidine kinase